MQLDADEQCLSDRDIQRGCSSRSTHGPERRHRGRDDQQQSGRYQLRANVQRKFCKRDASHADRDPQRQLHVWRVVWRVQWDGHLQFDANGRYVSDSDIQRPSSPRPTDSAERRHGRRNCHQQSGRHRLRTNVQRKFRKRDAGHADGSSCRQLCVFSVVRRMQRHCSLQPYSDGRHLGDSDIQPTGGCYGTQSHRFSGAGESLVRSLLWSAARLLEKGWLQRPVLRWFAAVQSSFRRSALARTRANEPRLRPHLAAAGRLHL